MRRTTLINFPYKREPANDTHSPDDRELTKAEMKAYQQHGALPQFQAAIEPAFRQTITAIKSELADRHPQCSTPSQIKDRLRYLRIKRALLENKRRIKDSSLLSRYSFFLGATLTSAVVLIQVTNGQSTLSPETLNILKSAAMAGLGGSAIMLGWLGLAYLVIPGYFPVRAQMKDDPKVRVRISKRRLATIRNIDLMCDALEHLQATEAHRLKKR